MFCTSYVGYYIWKKEKSKAERIEKKEKAKLDKRQRLNKYYAYEFKYAIIDALNPKSNTEIALLKWDEVGELKKFMLQDGYDRAEIDDLYINAFGEAKEHAERYFVTKK